MWDPGDDSIGEADHCGENSAENSSSLLLQWDQKKLLKMYGTSNSFLVEPQAYRVRLQQQCGIFRRSKSCPMYMEPDINSKLVGVIKNGNIVIGKNLDYQWVQVHSKKMRGYVQLDSKIKGGGTVALVPCDSFRRYELWPGGNIFCCRGHVMFGSDVSFLYFTNLIVVVVHITFGLSLCRVWKHDSSSCWMSLSCWSLPLLITTLVFFISAMVSLWVTALSDPGIMPRPGGGGDGENMDVSNEMIDSLNNYLLCRKCDMYTPPRSKHCSKCDNCIDVYDHHCPWTGSCVGRRNYLSFLILSTTLLLSTTFMLVVCSWRLSTTGIKLQSHNRHTDALMYHGAIFLKVILLHPFIFTLWCLVVITLWSLIKLFGYHMHLISVGQTTYEMIKRVYLKKRNKFHKGFVANFLEITRAATFPSRLHNMAENIKGKGDYVTNAWECWE
eukprot:68621_1